MTREECTLTRDKLDVCGRELLILGDNGQIFLENSKQLRDHCRRIDESMNCINNYADNCLKIFSKKYIKYLVYKTSEIVSVRCSTKSENLIRLAPCLNKVWFFGFFEISFGQSFIVENAAKKLEIISILFFKHLKCS
jgi:hypothetical protein